MKKLLTILFSTAFAATAIAQNPAQWNTPAAGNPFIPGYFADPTIRKFGDTYYIFATTDGTGNGYGPAQVWMSKDFVNWRNVLMNWPTTEVVWAPDVVQQPDGTFRYYYCTPCVVRVGESTSPIGPWKNRLGAPDAVLVPDRFVHNAITLDPQLFRDDDGSEYLYFGTWGIYKDFGCGVAKLGPDGKSFTDKKLILNTEIIDFFEAPFVFKKDGVYYFTYSSGSCHDDTYRVQYAISKEGPMGPYEYKGCILKTNSDGTIHGPGHHSILKEGCEYYIVYHRHNNPHAIHGFHRQLCIDRLEFDSQGNILPVKPTHDGLIPASLVKNAKKNTLPNLAFGAKVEASSTYSEWFRPDYAVDDNNGTLWRAADAHAPASLTIDLGEQKEFNQIFTQFEYTTFFYQYRIDISDNGTDWTLFADRTDNHQQGSPMVDVCEGYRQKGVKGTPAKARFIRLTITDTQKNGHFPAVWNVKVYRATKKVDPLQLLPMAEVDESAILAGYPDIHKKDVEKELKEQTLAKGNKLYELNADNYDFGSFLDGVPVVPMQGKSAFRFSGNSHITVNDVDLRTLTYNAPYTVTAWILNPDVSEQETVAQLMPVGNDLATVELRNSSNRSEGLVAHNASFENAGNPRAVKEGLWQHWTLTFDGFMERIYCGKELVSEKNIFLMLLPGGPITIGSRFDGQNPFSGYLHSLCIYDRPFTEADIEKEMNRPSDFDPAMLKSLAEKSPLRTKQLQLSVKALSPSVLMATVTDSEGHPLEKGIYNFTYACGNDSSTLAAASESSESSKVLTAQGKSVYVKVRDVFGYAAPVLTQKFKVSATDFIDLATGINAKATNGTITLESAGTNLNDDPAQAGPIEAVEVKGDFVMQCRVSDLTGADRRSTPAYNEGGLLLRRVEDERQSLMQLGVFPAYNCGNMLTTVNRGRRPQYPNGKGWDFDPYLQIQRIGNEFVFLTSKDGKTWTQMPVNGRTSFRPFNDQPVEAGLFQTTYSDNKAAVSFSDFHIWQKK